MKLTEQREERRCFYINVNAAASDLKTIKKKTAWQKQIVTKASPKHKNETKSILDEGTLKETMKWEDDEESELCSACWHCTPQPAAPPIQCSCTATCRGGSAAGRSSRHRKWLNVCLLLSSASGFDTRRDFVTLWTRWHIRTCRVNLAAAWSELCFCVAWRLSDLLWTLQWVKERQGCGDGADLTAGESHGVWF